MTEQIEFEAVETVLRTSSEYLDLNQIVRLANVDEPAAKAALKALAGSGQIEHIAGAGRRPTRYGWLATTIVSTPVAEPERELTPEAQAEREQFESEYGEGNCSCHLSAPCPSCVHPGNPRNQEEGETAWVTTSAPDPDFEDVEPSLEQQIIDAQVPATADPNPIVDCELPFGDYVPPAGYLVRASKRKPRIVRSADRAIALALAARRAGASQAEVFELVPIGRARLVAEFDPA